MAKTPAQASAKPAAASKPAAAPVAPAVAEKPARKQQKRPDLILHPALWDATADNGKGAPVKIDAVPDDYSPGKHKPLRKSDFTDEAIYHDYQAERFQRKADRAVAAAKQCRLIGAAAASGNAKKLVKMMARIADLRALCEADGVDVSAIDAMLATAADGEEVEATETEE